MVWTGCLRFLSYFFVIAGIFTFWLLSSPLLLVIKGDAEEEESFLSFLQSHYFPPRLTIILYLVQPSHPQYQRFPMNFLRSLGISNVETTHYLVLDIDLHPTGIHVSTFPHCRKSLFWTSLTPTLASKWHQIRGYFTNFFPERTFGSLRFRSVMCLFVDETPRMKCRSSAIQPSNKTELLECVRSGLCSSDKNGFRMHVAVNLFYNNSSMLCQSGTSLKVTCLE